MGSLWKIGWFPWEDLYRKPRMFPLQIYWWKTVQFTKSIWWDNHKRPHIYTSPEAVAQKKNIISVHHIHSDTSISIPMIFSFYHHFCWLNHHFWLTKNREIGTVPGYRNPASTVSHGPKVPPCQKGPTDAVLAPREGRGFRHLKIRGYHKPKKNEGLTWIHRCQNKTRFNHERLWGLAILTLIDMNNS